MSKSLIVILAVTLGASFASQAFAFDPQPEPPTEKSFQSATPSGQGKAKPNSNTVSDGRTLADYNIQKE